MLNSREIKAEGRASCVRLVGALSLVVAFGCGANGGTTDRAQRGNTVAKTRSGLSVAPIVRLTPQSIGPNATTWADANGGSVLFQVGPGGNAPQLTSANGAPAVRFNGFHGMQASLGDASQWNGITLTAVVRTVGYTPPLGVLFGSGGAQGSQYATSGTRWAAGFGTDSTRGLGRAGADGSIALGGYPLEPNVPYVITWKRSRSSGWIVRLNGTPVASGRIEDASFPTGEFRAHLGFESPAVAGSGGYFVLSELHLYPAELSAAETTQLEQSLAETYNLGWYADGTITAPDVLLGADLVAWYDATTLSLPDGAPVASWPSRTANTALSAAGAVQPVFDVDAINGHPAVVSDGVDDTLHAVLNPAIPSGSRPHFWVVMQNVETLASRMYLQVTNTSNNQGAFLGTNSTNWLAPVRGGVRYSSASSSANDLRAHIVSTGLSPSYQQLQFTLDGVPIAGAGDPGATSVPVPEVRAFSSWNNITNTTFSHSKTRIGEIIISKTAPTLEQSRAVHRYLAAKWRTTPPGCSVNSPCSNGQAGCAADHDCLPGLTCGIDAAPRFGHPVSAGGVCWNEVACTNPVPPPCGSTTSECGLCCEPRCGAPGQPDGCGSLVAATDSDSDGAIDCADECPYDSTRTSAEPDGCNPPPCQGSVEALSAHFECVLRSDASTAGVFVVRNASSCVIDAPIGPQNRFLNGTDSLGQPTRFQPGDSRVTVGMSSSTLVWHLGTADSTASASGPDCTRMTELRETPVRLSATRDGITGQNTGDEQDTSSPVTFRIPRRLKPTHGFAGNGNAQLTFRTTSNQLVTCSYRGGAQTANTSTEYDWARAQTYHFESCSNGAAAGSLATGTHFEMDVVGGDGRFGETIVDLDLGPGCSAELDPPLWPEEVVALRTGFNWASTTELPTTDPQGLPAMRYAMLYVEDPIQIDGLKRAGMYFRQRPLFDIELEQYDGQCGELGTASDDRGTFVYAIMTATAYNLLRSEALSAIAAGQDAPFRAILLPPIPDPAAANSDGTLSWTALKDSAFDYYDRSSSQQQPIFGLIADLVEGVGDLLEGGWEAGTELVGFIDKAIAGSVRIRLDFTVVNQDWAIDPGVGTPMQRAWGPQRGHELVPRGMDVEILARDGVIPESFWGKIGNEGFVTIDVAKNSRTRGAGMCVHLENDAAMISRGVTEREICNFEVNHIFNGFSQDVPFHGIPLFTRYFNYMAQLTDGFDYTRAVLGRTPKQAEVLVGTWANNFGNVNGNRAFAACLDFAEMGFVATEFLNQVIAGLTSSGAVVGPTTGPIGGGPVTDLAGSAASASAAALGAFAQVVGGPILLKDIYLPSERDSNRSRAVVTHEYGHFVMCDAYDESGFGSLPALYGARLLEGFDDGPDDTTAMAMEAFADLFSLQVASALNYVRTNDAVHSSGDDGLPDVQFCTAWPCIEENFRGRSETPVLTPYKDHIRRLVSTYHDAFDRPSDFAFSSNAPTNGDAWVHRGDRLGLRTAGEAYLQESDDRIALSGPAMLRWLDRGHTDTVGNLSDLAQTMYEEGFTWCKACELFAQHDPSHSFLTLPNAGMLWEMCNMGELRQILGPPPEEDLTMDWLTCRPCEPGSRSNDNGACVPCEDERAIVVNNECVPCPDGTIPNAENECVPCEDNEISIGLLCAPCVFGSKPNRATNSCESCPATVVVDWAASAFPQCDSVSFTNIGSSDPLCPFVLDVLNVDVIPGVAVPTTHLVVQTFSRRNHSTCSSSELDLHQVVEGTTPTGTLRNETVNTTNGVPCTESFCTSNCTYPANVFGASPQNIANDGVEHLRVLIDPDSIDGTTTDIVVTTGTCGAG